MGVVYEARHRNGKRVAIKLLHAELMVHADVLRRFLREGYLANAVEHPGVVSVLDDGVTEEGLPFMVMEFLEGENLDARMMRLGRALQLPDVLAIALATLDVLKLAHERGIIHRDIKPENVFLTATGGVKLLDFGIAYLLDSAGGMSSTRPGITVGTPTFMPREQAQGLGGVVDGQSDLWSLGATMFFALSGEFLFSASTVPDFLQKLLREDPRPLRDLVPSIPEPIARVIHLAIQHDRDLRWKSAGAMREALLAAAAEAGVAIPGSPALEGFEPPNPRLSAADISGELELNLAERLSQPFPQPTTPPNLEPLAARSLHGAPSQADTLLGVQGDPRVAPRTSDPPPSSKNSSRLSFAAGAKDPPVSASPPWRWIAPVLFGVIGLAAGKLFWSGGESASPVTSGATPVVPEPRSVVPPLASSSTPLPSVEVVPSQAPPPASSPVLSSARAPVRPPPASPPAGKKASSSEDLGLSRD
jgi:serine/threonine-protein kinase